MTYTVSGGALNSTQFQSNPIQSLVQPAPSSGIAWESEELPNYTSA